jgi:hypothetical protein
MKNIVSVLMSVFMGVCLLQSWSALETSAQEEREMKHAFTKHFKETLFDITTKAKFSVEILLDDREYKKLGKDVIGIVIHGSRDEDVEKADIAIDFRNLDTGETAVEKPVVKEKGDGLYTVSNLDLKKDGRRQLTITIKKGKVEDSARFLFPDVLKNRLPAGRYNP